MKKPKFDAEGHYPGGSIAVTFDDAKVLAGFLTRKLVEKVRKQGWDSKRNLKYGVRWRCEFWANNTCYPDLVVTLTRYEDGVSVLVEQGAD